MIKEKGAFTGALRERVGKFELADGGTLFLDEVTEMPIALQPKLLRVLQENVIERLGSNRAIPLDIRVIAATNRDPREAMRSGKLREDLFYRLNVIELHMPPLRERLADIPMLVRHFVEKFGGRAEQASLTPAATARLQAYRWPGNIRELENLVERSIIPCGGEMLDLEQHFPALPDVSDQAPAIALEGDSGDSLESAVAELECRLIVDALKRAGGSKARAAALLDISERTLWYKLKKLRIEASLLPLIPPA